MNTNETVVQTANNPVRSMVRGIYDLQHLRIQSGNRLAANFRVGLGQTPDGMSEEDMDKEQKKVLDLLRQSYSRITDGIVEQHSERMVEDNENSEVVVAAKLPTRKKFKGDGLISNYTELVLVHQYLELLGSETKHFKQLETILDDYPIYTEFLKGVAGVGPAMAGIIISEIDIHKAKYPSSLWMYAGLDTVTIGKYTNDKGEEKIVPARVLDAHYSVSSDEYLAEGKYKVTFYNEGRSRKEHALVDRTYTKADKTEDVRKSITFNPWLKTKLIGVLGGAFLKASRITVDGKRLGGAKRLALAIEHGFEGDKKDQTQVDAYLGMRGMKVVNESGVYNKIYYDYKNRLDNNPAHDAKSAGHKHNMAVRYAVKMFLQELYSVWRKLENLPVAVPYAEAKLGLTHGQMSEGKRAA